MGRQMYKKSIPKRIQGLIFIDFTRKYLLRGYILGSGAPGTPGVIPKTYGTTFISDIL